MAIATEKDEWAVLHYGKGKKVPKDHKECLDCKKKDYHSFKCNHCKKFHCTHHRLPEEHGCRPKIMIKRKAKTIIKVILAVVIGFLAGWFIEPLIVVITFILNAFTNDVVGAGWDAMLISPFFYAVLFGLITYWRCKKK